MKIEIAGPSCSKCKTTEANVKEAVTQLNIEAEIAHVSDIGEIAGRGIMFTPAVIVDGRIRISGRVPSVDEIKKILSAGK